MVVEKIKATPTLYGRKQEQTQKIKVAAYCRVSTDSEDQMNSYNSQMSYYKDLITKNKEYEFVGIYADPGITGTSTAKREEFQRMIADAKNKKIDLILTKSISRFARNTLDTLKYVRMLKEVGVAVKFEEENINTVSMDGELLLTILSSVAQQEVQNISANVKKGLDMKMQRGELVGFNGCLGYNYDIEKKTLTVNPEEAVVVKYIFKRYIDGLGTHMIAKELMKLGYKTKKGNTRWSSSTVGDILKNVKYKGDLVLGKTYTLDPISKKRYDNTGQSDMYYIKNHHEPIIDSDTFDLVQELIKKKRAFAFRRNPEDYDLPRMPYKRKYAFTGLTYCSYCGSRLMKRVVFAGTRNEKQVWCCSNHIRNGAPSCPDSRNIEQKVIEEAFVKSFNMLAKSSAKDIDDFIGEVSFALSGKDYTKRLKEISERKNKIERKKNNLLEMRSDDLITKEELYQKMSTINQELEALNKEEAEINSLDKSNNSFREKAMDFKNTLMNSNLLESFDRTIFESSVDRVIIGNDSDSNGITLVYKPEYSTDERKFDGKYGPINVNMITHFCCENNEESNDALKYINSNMTEMFTFDLPYEHFTFLPDGEGYSTTKVLRHTVPVRIMMATK